MTVQVATHRVDLDAKAGQQVPRELQRNPGQHADFGEGDPFGLPAATVTLVPDNHSLDQHGGVGAGQSGHRVEMLAAFGIAFVRHGDAADGVGSRGLTQLADLGSLELIHLIADPGKRAADHGQHAPELRDPVAGGEPGDSRVGQSELGTELGTQPQSMRGEEPKRADCSTELADQPARSPLRQPLNVSSDLVGPRSDFEAEGDRRTRLPVRPSGHERVAVLDCQRQQRLLDRPQIPPRHSTDIAHHQGEPGVCDVLHGRPDVHVLAGGLGEYLLQRTDQTQHRVRGPSGLHGDEIEVEQIGIAHAGRSAWLPRMGSGRGEPAQSPAR